MKLSTMGLRARLSLLVLLAVAPAFVLMGYTAIHQRQLAAMNARHEAMSLVRVAAQEQDQLIAATHQLLFLLSQLPALRQPGTAAACSRMLATLHKSYPYYTNFGVATLDGRIFCSALPLARSVNIADRSYFQRAVHSHGFGMGDYLVGRISGIPSLNFGYPILDAGGNPRAVVFAALNLSWLEQLISRMELPAGSTVTVIDSHGTVLARHPDPEKWVGKSTRESPVTKAMLGQQRESMAELVGMDGVVRLYAFAPLHSRPDGDVFVSVGIPKTIVLATANEDFVHSLALLVLAAGLALMAAWVGSNAFVLRRLQAFADAARRLGRGDLGARTGLPHGTEELGQLARSFDDMAATLQRVNRALKTLSAGNRGVVRAKNEPTLLEDTCRIFVQVGGYRLAWVGYAEQNPDKTVRPMAQAGYEAGYLATLNLTWADAEHGRGPTGTAIRTGKSAIARNVQNDPAFAPWREEARKRGYASSIALPLIVDGGAIGALCIYAAEADAFAPEEVVLLLEMANDLAYGISALRTRAERERAEEALHASEASLANAQRIAHLGNWDWDIIANTLRLSDEIYRIFGLRPQRFATTYEAFLASVHPADRPFVIEAVNRALHEKRPFDIDHRVVRRDGTERIVHEQGEVTFDDNGKAVRMIGTVQDVTEQRQAQERLHYLAHYDALTQLPNRTLLLDRLQQAMREADRSERLVAVLFLDLDRFKTVNDTLGHDVGDAMLQAVAERLTACLRPGDSVARLGGDEFAIVLANVRHVDDVTGVTQKVMHQFLSPFRLGGRDLFATASIGITLYPLDEKDTTNLLRDADVAMYRAKELGGNTFQFYTADLNARAARRLELENGLRQALEKGEFVLHYQPLVDIRTGRIRGMEALLRWQHPEFGLIPPLDFIPLAEETGLIIPIGEWVLRTACAQTKAWHDTGFPALQVAVNLSSKQLRDKNLIAAVRQSLAESGLEARYLDLELTESVLMRDMDLAAAILQELKAVGVRFSLDDFGTGYSSLSYLKHFPIDYLKVDRSFVHDMLIDPVGAGLVKAIIAMAHTLHIKVIAEGVETQEQLAFLRQEGCDITQGYFCSPPVDVGTFTELLRDWNQRKAGKYSAKGR